MVAIPYALALEDNDKHAIEAIEAPSGEIPRIVEFPNLRSLDLTGNDSIRDFEFLSRLPKLQELDLGKMGLSAIPAPVASLAGLTTLFLGSNSIKNFSILLKLPGLTDLGLEDMELRKIPNEVCKITGLKILGLADNEITSLSALKTLKALEELYAGNNRIKKLPKELAKLPLRKLAIMRNFPLTNYEVLGSLTQLEELWLSNSTEVDRTPACIFDLKMLKKLVVSLTYQQSDSAAIAGIDNIGNLEALEELTIQGTKMERLPESIGNLKRLRKLTLRENASLTSVDALRDLTSLEELDLSKCDLREVGDSFSTLKGLKRLTLSHNSELASVSGLRDLPALEELQLYSKLSVLPASLGTLVSLTKLELSAKTDDASFLAELVQLEELYLAGCSFDELPGQLRNLKKLTVFRDESAGDSYLTAYPLLVELAVSQPSFALPVLPSLQKLSIAKIKSSLDLSKIGACPALEQLSIHRSDTLTELPAELAQAKGVKRASFEFLKKITNISAVAGLAQLEELELSYLKRLKDLPKDLAGLTQLRKLELSDLNEVSDLSVLGALPALESLRIDDLEELQELPKTLAKLNHLRTVELRSSDNLKDISVLESVASLELLSVDYCDTLKQKSVAAVHNAIASRSDQGTELTTSYRQFIDGGSYKSLVGKEDAKQSYPFPLSFDTPPQLLEAIEDFSWLDDIRDDEGHPDNAILGDPDSALQPLAILDLGWKGCDTSHIDSYCEEIFLVDITSVRNPVFIWGHDGSPRKIHDDFDDFLANLRDFAVASGDDSPGGEATGSDRTYLEFVDGKSAKFWQIVVTGSQHEVTYGKIGKDGSAKVKEFDTPEAAQKAATKLIASKRSKGYLSP
jgi:internalin A